ncbi:hypothetical protein [Flavobacterium sp.]|uniref:hypothetical protein n=1 Tax=Flavobacterium sp. TaxID=239 RepID=UPI002BBE3837|nr:hypothetical protein [Flavobacterium sp.]HSD07904.1 hypothetical protein [Flavobacterium sp.]
MSIKASNNVFPHDPDYNWKEKLDRGGYDGTAKDLSDRIKEISEPDGILVRGEVVKVGDTLSIEANAFKCRIKQQVLFNVDDFNTTIAPATDGYRRIDIGVFTKFGTIVKIQGPEGLDTAQKPDVPNDTIEIFFVSVFGADIAEPSTPVEVNAFVEKQESSEWVTLGGNSYITFNVPGYSSIRFTGTRTQFSGVYIFPEYKAYSGKKLTIKNFQITDIILKHLGADDPNINTKFWFPTQTDLVLKPGQVIEFAYSFISNRFEFVGTFFDKTYFFSNIPAKATTLTDADLILAGDSEDGFKTKTRTFAQLIANLRSYFVDLTTAQTISGGLKTFSNGTFGLRNAANTFTLTFTNAITAARSVTWPDKNGTVAMTSDIVAQLNGVVNYLVKFGTATTGIASRLFDNGTFFGIGTAKTPTKDITLGNQANREFGIEESNNITDGRNLRVAAGRTINYVENAIFNLQGSIPAAFYGMCSTPSGNVYGVNFTNKLFKQTGGSGAFVDTGIILPINAKNITCDSGNNLYISGPSTDIYKQTNETGSFIAMGQTPRQWNGMCSLGTNVYASVQNGDIYKLTGGTGNFNALGQTTRSWGRMASSSTSVYVCVEGSGGIYKLTNQTGNFNLHTALSSAGITVSLANDVFIQQGTDIYKQTNETGSFVATGSVVPSNAIWGMATHANGNIYAGDWNGNFYVLQNNGAGTADLNGGNLDLVTGTGKGTGSNKLRFWIGKKTSSGTNMQVETLAGYFDENGFFVYLTPPIYANDAAADADANLPSGAFYKVTGNRTCFQKP